MMEPYRMIVINGILCVLLLGGIVFYRFKYPKKKINLFVLLLLISFLPIISIFRNGTYESGDINPHISFLTSFYENLRDGIWLPRWAGGLCGGRGCPVFIIEYILPFYIGSLFHFLGFSFLNSLKLLLAASFIASGITMYYWSSDEFGEVPGFVSSLLYLFAPYHLIDLHFRSSIGETLSYVFIPLLFLFTKKIVSTHQLKYVLLLAVSIALITFTHSSTTLVSMILVGIYVIILCLHKKKKDIHGFLLFSLAGILGLLFSCFYWLPALNEARFTWWRFTVAGDFKPIAEYLYSPVRYGLLFQGHQGEVRLIVGYIQLLLIGTALYFLFKHKFGKKENPFIIYWISAFFILFFMLQSVSKPIWDHIKILQTFIMVWRLLLPIAFVTSAIGGIMAQKIKSKPIIVLICLLTVLPTILNWGNRKMVPENKNVYFTERELYSEYFDERKPIYYSRYEERSLHESAIVLQRPKAPLEIKNGNATITHLNRTQILHTYVVNVTTPRAALVENTFYFPGWHVLANYKPVKVNYEDPDYFGLMTFILPQGLYRIDVRFDDTPVRKIAGYISTLTIMGTICVWLLRKFIFSKASGRA